MLPLLPVFDSPDVLAVAEKSSVPVFSGTAITNVKSLYLPLRMLEVVQVILVPDRLQPVVIAPTSPIG